MLSLEAGSLASASASLWCTRNSIDSLRTAHLSFQNASVPQSQGLEDVIRTVQKLGLRPIPSSKIGRGVSVGEGETFWVERCELEGKAVAVKHLKVEKRETEPQDSSFLRRVDSLLLELRIMHHAPLQSHPNILTLIGYGWNTEGGGVLPYILVEYCTNGNLREYLTGTRRDIELLEKEALIADVAAGIHALHTTGIIHGDIKLENVLVVDSNQRQGSPMAKICDFGHSILIGQKSDEEKHAIYTGTLRYNAPEVTNQKTTPITRLELKKCDVWAFGLLAWEVLLCGRHYTAELSTQSDSTLNEHSKAAHDPAEILKSALATSRQATAGTDDVERAIFRHLFKRALTADPAKRIGDLNSLAFMSKWRKTGTVDLSAQLALHTGASEWSYEVFRFDPSREIQWLHKEHIARQFLRIATTNTDDESMKGSAAWQTGLCYASGFGVRTDWNEADKFFTQAANLGSPIAQKFQKLLFRKGEQHIGERYTDIIRELVSVDTIAPAEALWLDHNRDPAPAYEDTTSESGWTSNDSSTLRSSSTTSFNSLPDYTQEIPASKLEAAIRARNCSRILALDEELRLTRVLCIEPPLIQGLRTRDWKVVETLLSCGLSPEIRDESGRNAFHWLFMLDEHAPAFASHFGTGIISPLALNVVATNPVNIHPQWPLQLEGTPLAHAVAAGCLTTIDTLISLGANPVAQIYPIRNQEIWSPLHLAVKYHRADILKKLLDITEDKRKESRFHTPLAVALSYSSALERVAIHGRLHQQHLEETISLLGPSTALGDASLEGVTALMRSVECNDIQVTTALIKYHPECASIKSLAPDSTEGSDFHYPVHHAAHLASQWDHPDALKILELIRASDTLAMSRLDSSNRTPLHLAASGTSSGAVAFLMKHDPRLLHIQDNFGARPLHYCESATVAEQLVMLGADVNAEDYQGRSPLCYAVSKGLGTVVRALCKLKARTDVRKGYLINPLHIAINNGMHEIMTTLISSGASINLPEADGNTPLHVAARKAPDHILKLILEEGADPLATNLKGLTALHIAVQTGNISALSILSNRSPELILKLPESTSLNQSATAQSPLYMCAAKNMTKAVNVMLPNLPKTHADRQDSSGRTILHRAAESGNLHLVKGLITRGVNLDARTPTGDTALTLAVHSPPSDMNRPDICRALISAGAYVTAQNNNGEMAWDIAVSYMQDEKQDDVRCILETLLLHSEEACRNVTRKAAHTPNHFSTYARVSCGYDLVTFALNRPDRKLLKALKARVSVEEFDNAKYAFELKYRAEDAARRERDTREMQRADEARRKAEELRRRLRADDEVESDYTKHLKKLEKKKKKKGLFSGLSLLPTSSSSRRTHDGTDSSDNDSSSDRMISPERSMIPF